jgi:hypothetical protein
MSKSSASGTSRSGKPAAPAPVVPPPEEDPLRRIQQNHAAIRLLEAWQTGDAAEQGATWDFLRQALDEDRPSDRKLFE